MRFKKYLRKSKKFVSAEFQHDEYKRESNLKSAIENFIDATEKLDAMKKHKYYGKDLPDNFLLPLPNKDGFEETFARDENDDTESNLHAVIGICTESGELLEAMYKHKWKGKQFDEVNAKEEVGDIFWYMAILFRNFNWNIKTIWARNIEKLTKRYGKKFSKEKAINRNTEEERKILEK